MVGSAVLGSPTAAAGSDQPPAGVNPELDFAQLHAEDTVSMDFLQEEEQPLFGSSECLDSELETQATERLLADSWLEVEMQKNMIFPQLD